MLLNTIVSPRRNFSGGNAFCGNLSCVAMSVCWMRAAAPES
jgi:hypothetical protein